MATIVARKRGKTKCYYFHETFRVKLSPTDQRAGDKRRGSGPSRVVTKEVYLGTAEHILQTVRDRGGKPLRISPRQFGLVMAAYTVVEELGIAQAVDALVPRTGRGLTVGTYVALMVVAKVCARRFSWRSFGKWLTTTTLARHLGLPASLLDAQNFWDAFERILPERVARHVEDEQIIWQDKTVLRIEEMVWERLLASYPVDLETVLMDATNFFTYLDGRTRARLARTAHGKAGRSEKRHVALSLAATRDRGLPLLHLTYAGNVHDVRTMPYVLTRLAQRLKHLHPNAGRLTLVFDRGYNSKDNLTAISKEGLFVVGALVISQHKDLLRLPVRTAPLVEGLHVIRTEKIVYGQKVTVLVTHSEKLERKQHFTFTAAVHKLSNKLEETFVSHHKNDEESLAKKMEQERRKSRVGRFLTWRADEDGHLHISADEPLIAEHASRFGLRMLYTTRTDYSSADIIRLYNHDKPMIEQDFREIKSPDLVRFAPIRHFTDTKIRLYAMVAVFALLVLKVMMIRVQDLGLSMEAMVDELTGIEEAILVYGADHAVHTITECSPLQEKLVAAFGLQRYIP